jgi:hypothetical protein
MGSDDDRPLVTLVHGTVLFHRFRRREPAFNSADGRLRRTLIEAGCQVDVFSWSGGNSHYARDRAADELAMHLANADHRNHWIVAHSHGGNVALRALGKPEVQERSIRLVTFATPFIHARGRLAHPYAVLAFVFFGILSPVAYFMGVLPAFVPIILLIEALFVVHTIIFCINAAVHGGWSSQDESPADILSKVQSPEIEHERVFALRAPGDEATSVLISGQFAAAVANAGSSIMAAPLVFIVVIFWKSTGAWAFQETHHFFGKSFFLAEARILVEWMTYVTALPAAAVLLVLTASLVFGLDGPYAALVASVSAESAPPGLTSVAYLGFSEDEHLAVAEEDHLSTFDDEYISAPAEDRGGLVLNHTRIYQDDRAIQLARDWITGRR